MVAESAGNNLENVIGNLYFFTLISENFKCTYPPMNSPLTSTPLITSDSAGNLQYSTHQTKSWFKLLKFFGFGNIDDYSLFVSQLVNLLIKNCFRWLNIELSAMKNNNNQQITHDVASTSRQRSHDMASTSTQRSPYPPGYRFMPTDKELIIEYLVKKVSNESIRVAEMSEVHLYEHTPQYLTENYPQLGDKEWYFFTPRDRKYPNGNRPNRSVEEIGYWKATGADKSILSTDGEVIGRKKALVYYEGKPKTENTKKTNWIMHEFKLNTPSRSPSKNDMRLDDWVLCRIYHKPERLNKKQKDVDDCFVDDDDESLAAKFDENDSFEDLGALIIQDNNINVAIDQNHDHGRLMMINGMGDNVYNHHQFPDNYQDGFNYPMEDDLSHHMNFYDQNNNFDYGMFYDQPFVHDQQVIWPGSIHQQDPWGLGNNGTNYFQQIYSSDFNGDMIKFVDGFIKTDEGSIDDVAVKNPDVGVQLTPKKRTNSERFNSLS